MLHYSCCLLKRSWSISLVCPEMDLSNITQQVPIPEAISAYFRFPSLHIPGLNDIFTAKTIIFGPPVPLTPHLPSNTDTFMDVCPVFFGPTVRAEVIYYNFEYSATVGLDILRSNPWMQQETTGCNAVIVNY